MTTIRNTILKIEETFNIKLDNQLKIILNAEFNFKDKIVNKFQVERKESQFQNLVQNFKNSFFIKLKFLTEKRYLIFEPVQNIKLKEFNFKSEFFEITGKMPEFLINEFYDFFELLKWAENILKIDNLKIKHIKYSNELNELSILIPKNIEKINKILNGLLEFEKNNSFKINFLKWCCFENFIEDEFQFQFEKLDSSKLTSELINTIIKLIDTDLFFEISFYLKSQLIWISPPQIFKFNFFVKMDEFLNNMDKYIKIFNLFKHSKFINLIARMIKAKEIEKFVKNYFSVFERFESNLNKIDETIRLIDL